MLFDVYGRFRIEVRRQGQAWVAYYVESKKTPVHDVVIPPSMEADEIARYLDDVYHEASRPGDTVRRVDD